MKWEVTFVNVVEEKWIVEVEAETATDALEKARNWQTVDETLEDRESKDIKNFEAKLIEE